MVVAGAGTTKIGDGGIRDRETRRSCFLPSSCRPTARPRQVVLPRSTATRQAAATAHREGIGGWRERRHRRPEAMQLGGGVSCRSFLLRNREAGGELPAACRTAKLRLSSSTCAAGWPGWIQRSW